ncbi:MAG: hypothetical protein U0Z70_17305 [Thermomicrobiales bacterium]|nr:hypothetical protein [Chloroflexia bacterium]
MNDDAPAATATPASRRRLHRVALVLTVSLLLIILLMLPIAIRSMQEVLGRGPDPLYRLSTGQVVDEQQADEAQQDRTYVNFGLVGLDEANGEVTIAVSGNRKCQGPCPQVDMLLASLDNDADTRRGLPPSVPLTLKPEAKVFSDSVVLPVRGQPSLYPFDEYRFWLGVGGTATLPDGRVIELSQEMVSASAVTTLQNRIPDMIMKAPTAVDPETMRSVTDPYGFQSVNEIVISRPAYLQVLAVVLVVLIGVSALMALLTRSLDDLALGFGGLILGVWGIRSILMPQSLSTVTAIDLALSWLILLLLLGLGLRAALYFLKQSELPIPSTPISRPKTVHRRKKGGTATD